MTKAKRVLVAMSGGVDSSVTAHLLKQQGYDCEGVTMRLTCSRTFDDPGPRSCCSLQDIADAQAVCERIGIPYRVLDMRELFEQRVVEKFVATYEDGRTPNPCIDCNRYMKFGALLDWARAHGFDAVATGHYARIEPLEKAIKRVRESGEAAPGYPARTEEIALLEAIAARAQAQAQAERAEAQEGKQAEQKDEWNSKPAEDGSASRSPHALSLEPPLALSLGVDDAKDQSYVLYSLTQKRLAHTVLPLGGLVKARDVREIAEEQGFVNAEKPDSQGICFVPDNDFATYIERRENRLLPEGDVVDTDGNVLGRHQGAIRYTVGQRKGLGVAMLHPMYVTAVDAAANTVTLGENEDLMARELVADDWIWSAPADAMRELLDEAERAGAQTADDGARSGTEPTGANVAEPLNALSAGLPVSARIRYHQKAQTARLSWDNASCLQNTRSNVAFDAEGTDGRADSNVSLDDEMPGYEHRRLRLVFDSPQRAIAPGQAVVVYAAGVVLGGGTVCRGN